MGVQYGGCIGMRSGLLRVNANSHPGAIIVDGNVMRVHFRTIADAFTSPGWPEAWSGNPACTLNPMRVDYFVNSSFAQTAGVSGTPGAYVDMSGTHACKLDNLLELRFRLGTADISGHHAADGYFEVRVNGVVQISVTGIALGNDGAAGYSMIHIAPSGTLTPDDGIYNGMTDSYANQSDVYGAGDPSALWNEAYAAATDADTFTSGTGPWVRHSNGDTAPSPTINAGLKVFANLGYMSRPVAPSPILVSTVRPTPSIDVSPPCCASTSAQQSQTFTPNAGPIKPPVLPDWTPHCSGGGTVPTQADVVNSEDWSV